jgi:hypothetical protein
MADLSLPVMGKKGTAPTLPRFSKFATVFRERVAIRPTPSDPLARQAAIENALSMALHLVRTSDTTEALQRATGRAIRAASMLKQACSESATTVRA